MWTIFNQSSRTANVVKASSIGTVCHFLSYGMGFVYRTVFIAILSAAYLGINGLFWNLLAFLSLAELGIGEVIVYRFYRPIAENDVKKVGELMGFFKQVYRLIALVITAVGLAIYPFLNFFIKDPASVPADVNLNLVYLLYLAQSIVSYTFVYRLTIWTADQKRYVSAFLTSIAETSKFGAQILVLWLTRDFTLTLVAGIVAPLVLNIAFSIWTTHVYRPVFKVEGRLPFQEKVQIFKDAGALMCHKVGAAVVANTDSIVLAKFVGLVSVGVYSNYCLLTKALDMLLRQAIGGFTASFGNAAVRLSKEDYHTAFRRMQFVNLAVAGGATACFALLVDGFVRLWLGEDMVFARLTTIVLSVQFYIVASRLTVESNISATGLFVKDRPRPLIEAVLNLVISILLVRKVGLVGVFIGTILSAGLTVFWRAPYILYRHAFEKSVWIYWRQYGLITAFSALFVLGGFWAGQRLPQASGWADWTFSAMGCAAAYGTLFLICFCWMPECRFFLRFVRDKLVRFGKGKGKS